MAQLNKPGQSIKTGNKKPVTEADRKKLGGQYYDGTPAREKAAKIKNLQMTIKDTQKRYNFEKKQKGFPASGTAYYTERLASLNSQLSKIKGGK